MVPWPFSLNFGREMGTHPGRSGPMFGLGTPTTRVRGPKDWVPGYNLSKLSVVCLGLDVAAGQGFTAGSCSEAGWALQRAEVLQWA